MPTGRNTWGEFKSLVRVLLTTDKDRLGLQDSADALGYLSRLIAQAVLDLQEYVTALSLGHEDTFQVADLVADGCASRGTMPAFSLIREASLVVPDGAGSILMAALRPFPWSLRDELTSGQLILSGEGMDWNCRLSGGRFVQIYNPDTGNWHSIFAVGFPAQLCLDDGSHSAQWEAPTGYRRSAQSNYRLKNGKWLQFYNADTGRWHTLLSTGTPAQLMLDNGITPPTGDRNYRLKDGKGIQIFNSDTGLWHTLIAGGEPAQVAQDEGESAVSTENGYIALDPTGGSFLVYPALVTGQSVRLVWDGNKSAFADTDPVPFPEEAALAVAEFVKGYLAREVDGDLAKLQTYFHPREGSYIKARKKLYLSSRRSF